MGLGKYAPNRFYIEYSIYTHTLTLWIKGSQFFRNCMCDAIHNKSFGSGLTAMKEVHRRICFILDDIFLYSTDVCTM